MTIVVIDLVHPVPQQPNGWWGYVPEFLDEHDPRSAREQIAEKYVGGWNPLPGGTFDIETLAWTYPGDPPQQPVSIMIFRRERLIMYPHEFVLILSPDRKSWEISRMD